MSGGSYNYVYRRIDEIDHWASTLEEMAADCKRYAAETKTVDSGSDEHHCVTYRDADDIDRAQWLAHALRLENAAEKIGLAAVAVHEVKELMHDVEWVESGDYHPCQLNPERAVSQEKT